MYFLGIQNTYTVVQVGLFKDGQLIEQATLDKHQASSHLIVTINTLLASHHLSFSSLSFITANQGPGPFTTLRTVLATVNGLAFATQLPLIGIDGLDAMLDEHTSQHTPITVALLNAYGQDVYFGIAAGTTARIKGWKNGTALLQELNHRHPTESITFIGAGVSLVAQDIISVFGTRAVIPEPQIEQCSLAMIGTCALQQWNQKLQMSTQLLPLYLKTATVKNNTVLFT